MKVPRRHAIAVALLVAATGAGTGSAAAVTTYRVNSTVDAVDANPLSGQCRTAAGTCTLRAALQAANANLGQSIVVVPAGHYRLTIPPVPEAGSLVQESDNGDLDITGDVAVQGAGPGRTVLDGDGIDRVLYVGAAATATVSELTITGGDATANDSQEIDLGGGILNDGALTLDDVELVGNRADGGGGMFSIPGTNPIIRNSLIDGNTAYEGGGLRLDQGGTIVNTTVTGNTLLPLPSDLLTKKPAGFGISLLDEVTGYGGGIDNRDGAGTGLLTITNSTIAGNHAIKGGGGLSAGQGYAPLTSLLPGSVRLHNTIIAGNTSARGPQQCRTNEVRFISLGHNLASDGSCFLTGAGDLPNTDPQLAPLAANGGPLRTMALAAGSPAIAAGSAPCPATDARGVPRPAGTVCDIGAYQHVTRPRHRRTRRRSRTPLS